MSALHSIPTSQSLPHQVSHLQHSTALMSNVAGVSHGAIANEPQFSIKPATVTPEIASVPEATSAMLNAAIAEHPLSQQMQNDAKRDAAIMEAVRASLAHAFAGQAETYLPAHERMAIIHQVMEQAHHFRETAKTNPDINITHLENMIGAHSALGKSHKERVAKHHPDHPHNKMQAQQVAANDAYYAHNVHAHPTHHSLSGVEHHGTVHELQHLVGTATH